MTEHDDGVTKAIRAAGSIYRLASDLGIHRSAVLRWRQIPPTRVLAVERITGVSRTELRPDLYPAE